MIRVMIVDAYTVLRHGLRLILQEDPCLEIVGEAANTAEAVRQATTLKPDLMLIEPELPDLSGPVALKKLQAAHPDIPILVLSTSERGEDILAAFQAGAKGYLSKKVNSQEIIQTIHQIARGEAVLPPELTTQLLHSLTHPLGRESLTARELDVLQCITAGLGNREIASTLHISHNTVKTHVRRILYKLNLRSRTEAATYALKNGLVHHNRSG